MKKPIQSLLLLSAPLYMWSSVSAQDGAEIDLSNVVVVEEAVAESPTVEAPAVEVVEIPEPQVAGVEVVDSDFEVPSIPVVTEALPEETEIVLEIPGQEDQAPGEASMASEETISVDFPDEDIRTILRNVADLFDLNLVIPDALQGRTSIKLRNVSWEQVFEEVLRQVGYTYVVDRNIIRVTSIEELTTEPVDTRVFIVNYARANEIQGSIAPLVDGTVGGQIRVDTRSNALVITERPSKMNRIQDIIERLDRPTAQVMIESKFIEVTQDDIKNVIVNWASLSGYSASAGPFTRSVNDETIKTDTDTNGLTVTQTTPAPEAEKPTS